jgi:hypothetical protein
VPHIRFQLYVAKCLCYLSISQNAKTLIRPGNLTHCRESTHRALVASMAANPSERRVRPYLLCSGIAINPSECQLPWCAPLLLCEIPGVCSVSNATQLQATHIRAPTSSRFSCNASPWKRGFHLLKSLGSKSSGRSTTKRSFGQNRDPTYNITKLYIEALERVTELTSLISSWLMVELRNVDNPMASKPKADTEEKRATRVLPQAYQWVHLFPINES